MENKIILESETELQDNKVIIVMGILAFITANTIGYFFINKEIFIITTIVNFLILVILIKIIFNIEELKR